MKLFFKPPEHTKYYYLNSAPFTDLYNIYKGKINRLLSGCFVTFIPPSCYLSSVPSNINISFSGLTTSCITSGECLHDTGATFAPERVHSGSSHGSIFVYMIPPQISCWRESPRFLYRGENFTPVRISQRYHVNTKRPPVSV